MPSIHLENCTQCLKCVKDCPSNAIDIEHGSINNNCIHCGHCVAICPESTIYPDEDIISKLQPSTVSPEDFQNLSAGLRTCRSYWEKEVDEATLNLLIDNMKHYPSASNARPVKVNIVKSPEIIQKLNDRTAEKLLSTISFITSPLLRPVLQILAPKLDLPRLNKYKKQYRKRHTPESSLVCHHAPVVFLFHAPVTKYGMAGADAYIWATYTSIFANTLGLGSCFNGFISKAMERSRSMRNEFEIPPGNQVYAALLIGHPKVKYINETGRKIPQARFI